MAPIIGRNRSAGTGVVAAMPNYRRLASLPALLLSGLLVAACASAPAPPSTPAPPSAQPTAPDGPSASPDEPNPSEAVDGIWVAVETLGGHCLEGACGGHIVIEVDGRAHQVEPEPKELGTVPLEIMQALVVEVQQADFEAIKSQPFTDTCPIAFDGQQFIYTFWIVTYSERIDSCEVVVDPANPLFIAVDAAVASVAPN
jgi:hypothetical protein